MSESARNLWRSIHSEFELTTSQRGMVVQLVEAIALADAAKAMMRAEGLVVATGTGWYGNIRPVTFMKRIYHWLSDFGGPWDSARSCRHTATRRSLSNGATEYQTN